MKQSGVSTVCAVPEPINHNTLTCAHNIHNNSFVVNIAVALFGQSKSKLFQGQAMTDIKYPRKQYLLIYLPLSLLNPCLMTFNREYIVKRM